MKFGQNLLRNQVPEWAANYINYKGLKKLIKSAARSIQDGSDPDLAEFFFSLDRNLEDVDAFYNKKYAESSRRLKLLHDRYGSTSAGSEVVDRDDIEDLMGALLEIRGQLRNLQWYAELNRKGFVKITKKLGKKTGKSDIQQRYIVTKVDTQPFATNQALSQELHDINSWLSALGEAKGTDDTSSEHSSSSLRGVAAGALSTLPASVLESLDRALRKDDSASLTSLIQGPSGIATESPEVYQKRLHNILHRALSCKAKRCTSLLLAQIESLIEEDDIHKRNCIHRLVISTSRAKSTEFQTNQHLDAELSVSAAQYITPAAPIYTMAPLAKNCGKENNVLLSKNDDSVLFLQFVLNALTTTAQRSSLEAKDAYGRMPIHYAAQYGFVAILGVIIDHMQQWNQFKFGNGIDSAIWQDIDGLAPLHLAVINQHPLATECLLRAEQWNDNQEDLEASQHRPRSAKSGEVLALATKQNSVAIVQLLVAAGVDVNFQDAQGETALHVAARFGHRDCALALLDTSSGQNIEVDSPEKTFSWTPLFIASVDGHLSIVDLLIEAGAELERVDSSGWTAKEHAALRGHLDITRRLAEFTPIPETMKDISAQPTPSGSPSIGLSLEERKSQQAQLGSNREPKPIKSFGHRYLAQETMVLVSLGSTDITKSMNPVILDAVPLADAHSTQLDTALSIVVSATGANGESTVIDLPVQENISTEPITFMTSDISKVKLLFDIVPTYAGSNEKRVGRGAAILSAIRPDLGNKRMLQGDVSIPIIAASTLDVIGTVSFNFLIITPFEHPKMAISEQHTYWKRMTSTMVIGHRGLGKNMNDRRSLQLGENTIQSFIAAANLGASYVEFDVQLTKDHVPVIYHDFLVGETGIDAPVHTLTLEQFLAVSEAQTPRPSRTGSPDRVPLVAKGTPNDSGKTTPMTYRPRSYSAGGASRGDGTIIPDMIDRMKHTKAIKEKGFKANVRGNFIQAPFTTLEEMFRKLPPNIGFNIEMKYPRLDEAEQFEMDAYAVELNRFVDTVLTTIYEHGMDRNVIFSSFHPDICLLLSFKQPSIPVLFLTDAGTNYARDIRTSSLQEAIRFASRWNLLGVVSNAEPICLCPRLVRAVKESGLVCVTYGMQNNETKYVKLQVKEGIDAVIVDNVLAIRRGLTEDTAPDGQEASMTTTTTLSVPRAMALRSQSEATVPTSKSLAAASTVIS